MLVHSPKSDAQFAYAMEDILEVYHREYQDDEVLVCMDEAHRQQVKEVCGFRARPNPEHARDVQLRVRTQRREQPVYVVRTTGRLATRGRNEATHESRLGTADPTVGGRGLPG